MNTNFKKTIAAGIIGITALGGAAFAVPGLAAAQDDASEAPEAVTPEVDSDRDTRRAERLQGLVDDGTITQEQADAMAERSGEGRGHKGRRGTRGLTAAADVLGMTAEDLRTALRSGDTLADVANAQGVAIDELSGALVAAKTEKLAAKVADGSITQEQADEKAAQLEERVAARINGEHPERQRGTGLSGAVNSLAEMGGLGA